MIQSIQTELDVQLDSFLLRRRTYARAGVFSVGFHRYWPQFPGLKERLEGYRLRFEEKLRALGADVVSAGMVDSVDSGRDAGGLLAAGDVDIVFCFVSTYVPSAFVLPVAQRTRTHMVLTGLQPTAGMDPEAATTAEQLAHDNCTSMPEISYALRRAGFHADAIFGTLDDDARAWSAIEGWLHAACAVHALRHARIGLLGHPFEGMLDMNADPTSFDAAFGMHVDMIEMCDLHKRTVAASDAEVRRMTQRIQSFFSFPEQGADSIAGPVTAHALEWSARVGCGLDSLLRDFKLDGLAHYYRGVDGNEYTREIAGIIVGASMLTAEGYPIAGEGDLKNCIAMMILDRIGAGGSFCELHPANLREDYILIGHDGPGHIAISNERPALRGLSLFHGKFGDGISVEFKVRTGPVTIAALTLDDAGRFKLVLAEGESVPGSIPASGNTNTRCRFKPDVATFVERWTEAGPTHHFALGIGRHIATLKKVARLTGMAVEVVAE